MATIKIFFTLAGTFRAIDEHRVDDRDLRTGLFCLDCTRSHAFEPWTPYAGFDPEQTNELKQVFADRGDAAGDVHMRVLDALRRAERDGRVLYLVDDTDWHDADTLNAFLDEHGFGRPIPEGEVFLGHDLEFWLEDAGHEAEVIC